MALHIVVRQTPLRPNSLPSPSLTVIVNALLEALPNISYMTILLLLYMFISAIAGMQLFGGQSSVVRRRVACGVSVF